MSNLCSSFSLFKKYIRRRLSIFILVLIGIITSVLIFILFSGKANILEINTETLVYTGLLIIFYAYVMEMHYKELHQIATDPALLQHNKGINIKYYEDNFEHNKFMVILSFLGILILLSSGILNIINLEIKSPILLYISILFIFAASIGILAVLWFIIYGKIKDANRVLNDYKTKNTEK